MIVKLLTEPHSGFLSLTGSCTGWSESTLVKMPHCWKSQVVAQLCCLSLYVQEYLVLMYHTTLSKEFLGYDGDWNSHTITL